MNVRICLIALIVCTVSFTACAQNQSDSSTTKPGRLDIVAVTVEATVEAIDVETRQVTLKGPEGNSYTVTAGEEVRNLAQVDVGDTVTIQVIEAVEIQVYSADEAEPGVHAGVAANRAKPGDKPAGAVVSELVEISTIKNIDLETNLVTLQGKEGKPFVIIARNPENLKRVAVGDRVKITYVEAVGIQVTKEQ